jgi:phosphohistidine phosphatase SixA
MFISCITHADARDKKAHRFRGLTSRGWREVESAAQRFRALIDEETPKIELVVSSPKARCVETALLMAKALSDLCATSEIVLDAGLKAGSISGNELSDLGNRVHCQHVLISAHADLVGALPAGTRLMPVAAQKGWFTTRPVLILVKYEPVEPWAAAQVLACEGLLDDKWVNLLQG